MIRVVAPSRLHFGLFHVPPAGVRREGERAFGGVGLLIDTPGVVVTAKPAETWQFEGMLASRAQAFAMRFAQSLPEAERRPFQVLVERCPPEHTGLGVGTQLALSVAKALAVAVGRGDESSVALAERVGRGERSAIGVHGFDRGGLLLDAGKLPGERISPLVVHTRLPGAWRVVLFTPAVPAEWHGQRERDAFAQASGGDPDSLRQLAETAILPAAQAGDLDAFGEAIHEFNRRAGEPFAAAQGGLYASPVVADLIEELSGEGVRAVGQSSWGPTVFAIVGDEETAMALARRHRGRMMVTVARVSEGYRVESNPTPTPPRSGERQNQSPLPEKPDCAAGAARPTGKGVGG